MKIVVIGLGQCGGRIADEFAKLNNKAKRQRGIEIVTGAFAVNTDAADLSGLTAIKRDYQHRILIGGRKTGGHGVDSGWSKHYEKQFCERQLSSLSVERHSFECR